MPTRYAPVRGRVRLQPGADVAAARWHGSAPETLRGLPGLSDERLTDPAVGTGQAAFPGSRQIWFFLVLSALAASQVHWWISAPGEVDTVLTSTHLPLWTATSW